MCIRDRGQHHTHSQPEQGTRHAYLRQDQFGPVSYTHLDVYKRQGNQIPQAGLQRRTTSGLSQTTTSQLLGLRGITINKMGRIMNSLEAERNSTHRHQGTEMCIRDSRITAAAGTKLAGAYSVGNVKTAGY